MHQLSHLINKTRVIIKLMDQLIYPLLVYCALSVLCFIFPIRKKTVFLSNSKFNKFLTGKVVFHSAHRGGCRESLENTIEAFDHAVKLGTNCLEMDVCMTKDKKIVVVHDSHLGRICGVNQLIHEFNYTQIPPFQDKVRLDFAPYDFKSTTTCKTKYMPLLEEIFQRYPSSLINLEIKTPTPETVYKVNELIKQYNREKTIIWGAKYVNQSDFLYEVNPNIPRFFTQRRVLLLYFFYIVGLLPFINIQEDSLQIPMFTQDFYRLKMSCAMSMMGKLEVAALQFVKIQASHSLIWMLNKISWPLFYHLGRRGVFIVYWVLNNETEFDRAVKSGCHGIMTDCPTLLRNYLAQRGLFYHNDD